MLLFGVANTSDTFLLLRATDLFSKETPEVLTRFSASPVGGALILTTLVYLLFNVTYVLFSYPAGVVSDRIGRWPVLAVGLVLYAGVYVGFGFGGAALMWALFAVYGIYKGLTDGVGKALIADHAPKGARGTALGLFYMVTGFATLGGNLVAGWLWDAHGPRSTFLFCAIAAGAAVVAIPLTAGLERS
jgi:MFS family permease